LDHLRRCGRSAPTRGSGHGGTLSASPSSASSRAPEACITQSPGKSRVDGRAQRVLARPKSRFGAYSLASAPKSQSSSLRKGPRQTQRSENGGCGRKTSYDTCRRALPWSLDLSPRRWRPASTARALQLWAALSAPPALPGAHLRALQRAGGRRETLPVLPGGHLRALQSAGGSRETLQAIPNSK
jgi:hypothetical protein